jgi:hypothetical protein
MDMGPRSTTSSSLQSAMLESEQEVPLHLCVLCVLAIKRTRLPAESQQSLAGVGCSRALGRRRKNLPPFPPSCKKSGSQYAVSAGGTSRARGAGGEHALEGPGARSRRRARPPCYDRWRRGSRQRLVTGGAARCPASNVVRRGGAKNRACDASALRVRYGFGGAHASARGTLRARRVR